ncbi:hypothetical protein EWM64_g1761 [Hericium alpestre]|uniref:Peptidase C14 caspase domain-containing protein n=1 Tax=Hericium alpestre TaxID=135208 RepID=A0A4Z0A9N2_9AGAM|nr:hypothetical protein EWM64_g1761 [Hericium alpestre]
MWNNDYPGRAGGYRPPPGPPPASSYGQPPPSSGLGFPSPDGQFNMPGYAPLYGPPGVPPGAPPAGYGPPGGPPYAPPPPPGPPPIHHEHRPGHGRPPSSGGYGYGGPPPGPPPGAPSRPPPIPGRPSRGDFAPPPGPPPSMPPSDQQRYGPQFEGANHQTQQPFFQYSQCNGKKKALCIGINYIGTSAELKGCINDARNIERFLCSNFGYKRDDIVVLTDDQQHPRSRPTKENMLRAMQWLVQDAHPNDSLFFHYSGHGGQTKDLDGDEADGYDEVIYPVDFKENGHIVDDEMHAIMVRPLPPGCRLTAIYDYSTEGKIKEPNLAAEAGQGLLSAATSYARGDMGGVFQSVTGLLKSATGNASKANEKAKATRTSPADVISFSGCKDSQTSADAVEAGAATGAMSYALITALSTTSRQSYQQLLQSLRGILKAKYSQKPQLSSSHPMDTNLLFIC